MARAIHAVMALLLGAVLAGAGPGAAEAADNGYKAQKVVYHINYDGGDEARRYKGALRNIQNHINAVGADSLEVKVVLHGDGVYLLREAKQDLTLQGTVAELKRQKVAFQVCRNTLAGRDIDPDEDLFDVWEDDIVPSGVAQLAHLQQQGYTYIKP